MRNSVVLTFDQVKKDVQDFIKDRALDFITDYMKDSGLPINFFERFHPSKMQHKEVLDMWAELCADDYFKKNPEINDILVRQETFGHEWVASNDD